MANLSSQQVFIQFLKTRPDGSLNAEDILSEACYKAWLASRRKTTQNPAESFRRALTATCRASDGRKPFPEDVENALLKELRKKQIWACFKGTDIQIGKKGFPSQGFHEKKRREKLCSNATRKPITNSAAPGESVLSTNTEVKIESVNDVSLNNITLSVQPKGSFDGTWSHRNDEEIQLPLFNDVDIQILDPTTEAAYSNDILSLNSDNRRMKRSRSESKDPFDLLFDTTLKKEREALTNFELGAEDIAKLVHDERYPTEVKEAARSFLDYYTVRGLKRLIECGRRHGVEHFTTPLMYMIDLHPREGDPRFRREFLCPSMKIKFNSSRAFGTMYLSPELLVVDSDKNLSNILCGPCNGMNAGIFQVSRLESLLVMRYGLPRLMKYGENWHFARLYRNDGSVGVFLVHATVEPKGHMKLQIQDISDKMEHILNLPLEI